MTSQPLSPAQQAALDAGNRSMQDRGAIAWGWQDIRAFLASMARYVSAQRKVRTGGRNGGKRKKSAKIGDSPDCAESNGSLS